MASIVKRKSKYSVVYTYLDEQGNKKQRWESFVSNAEAKKRKAQVEYEQATGAFIPPNAKTVRDLLEEYVSIYGISTWALSTYQARKSLIDNYINPSIGEMKLEDISPRVMDQYYKDLMQMKAHHNQSNRYMHECVSARTVREIHKLLRSAFNQGVKWELIARNPVLNATLPKTEAAKRDIWTAETLFHALEVCEDDNLSLALNLAFSCSLRIGEMLALTWDCIDISPASIANGRTSIYVDKELQRVSLDAMEELGDKDVIKVFPPIFPGKHTRLVLKTPKTKSSVRKIFLPKTVAAMLQERKNQQEELKDLLGDEYRDYDLVFASTMGTPIEGQIINRALGELIKQHNLPKVVFHSLRHSSITYKLKLNGGDMKAVQGDSGHAQVKMVADVYSHIIDEDRRINAELFEETFYSGSKAEPVVEEPPKSDQEILLALLNKSPEMVTLLKTLAQTL